MAPRKLRDKGRAVRRNGDWLIVATGAKLKEGVARKTFAIVWMAALISSAQETTPTTAIAEADGFRVISSMGPDTARMASEGLLRAQERLSRVGAELRSPHLPTYAIVLGSALDLRPFLTSSAVTGRTRALSMPAQDRNYILAAWTAPGDPLVALEHELVHLADPDPEAPMWVREGRAEALALQGRDVGRHLNRLEVSPWLPLRSWRFADRDSAEFGNIVFYAQSWLATEWLVSRGAERLRVSDGDLGAAIEELGIEGVEAALFSYFQELRAQAAFAGEREPVTTRIALREGADWEIQFALADVERALGRMSAAVSRLERLGEEARAHPEYARTLGAIQMDLGRYAEAEPLLARAVEAEAPEARTRYRYALMLLRPVEDGDAAARAEEAVVQSRLALAAAPRVAAYRFTLVQAETAAQRWSQAIAALQPLLGNPDHAERAQREYETILLRRQQALRAVEAPVISAAETTPTIPGKALSERVNAPPPPSQKRPPWPPPGTTLTSGQIDFVDCSGPEKVVILRSQFFPMRFRERKDRPARIYTPPYKEWTSIPCSGARGMLVNLAYKPIRQPNYLRGEVVAILF